MADIAPLTPLRYDLDRLRGGLASVIAPPYDVISPEERKALAARDPHNIVRLILPQAPDGSTEGDAKYANAASILSSWIAEGVLVRDPEPGFYRYDQKFVPPGGASAPLTRRGFLALVRLAPFSDRVVLPHERTLSGPKEDRLKLFRATKTNLSPGFMLYRDPEGQLNAPLASATTLAEFTTPDGIAHTLAKVRAPEAIRAIVAGVARSQLLIADGHHRYETAVRYSEETTAAHAHLAQGASAGAEHRYFMTFLVNGDDPNLVVFPTHRHVHSLQSFSYDDLEARAKAFFRVRALPAGCDRQVIVDAVRQAGQSGPSVVAAGSDGRAMVLTLRDDVDLGGHPTLGRVAPVLRKTDVAILHSGVLEDILGISPAAQAAKTNLWYPQDAGAALGEVRSGRGNVLFVMNATPVAQVREAAEAGEVMPQKSTFFYPKVPTGLAIHTLDPERAVAGVVSGV
jgi:uncharacterized protein (DUF1015 family)